MGFPLYYRRNAHGNAHGRASRFGDSTIVQTTYVEWMLDIQRKAFEWLSWIIRSNWISYYALELWDRISLKKFYPCILKDFIICHSCKRCSYSCCPCSWREKGRSFVLIYMFIIFLWPGLCTAFNCALTLSLTYERWAMLPIVDWVNVFLIPIFVQQEDLKRRVMMTRDSAYLIKQYSILERLIL